MSERIANLQSAICNLQSAICNLQSAICNRDDARLHGLARHIDSTPVIELFQGGVAWDGVVEAFELFGNPRAKRCYAWSYVGNDEPQYVTVLEIPPVNSAETAVKIAIAAQSKT